MDVNEFREFGKAAVDYIADYYETVRDKQVVPDVEPGYIRDLLPSETPQRGEPWQNLLQDVGRIVVPGLTHWQSPDFYAYYPASYSFPSVVGDLLSTGLGCVGINWLTGPVITELEVVMMDWLGKLLEIPEAFLNGSEGPGGGIIKGTASEATLVCLLAAKDRTLREIKSARPELTDCEIRGRIRVYSSDQSNSSIEKAALIASTTIRLLSSDDEGRLQPEELANAIEEDLANGLFPCYVVATLGTTGTCSFDDLTKIGPICEKYKLWLHVDAAYAGAAFACPEFRHHKAGLEFAESFNFNPHKFMLVNFDCSALWVKNSRHLVDAFTVERQYLKHEFQDTAPEYLHWQIPLGRRFRALKIWFVLRSYGVEGIQAYIRRQVALARYFCKLLEGDAKFEVCCCNLALVCFRLKGEDRCTKVLLDRLNERKKMFVMGYIYKGNTIVRMSMNSNESCEADLDRAFGEIKALSEEILENYSGSVLRKESLFEIQLDTHIKLDTRD